MPLVPGQPWLPDHEPAARASILGVTATVIIVTFASSPL
jgi:hypothetical protein